MGLPERPEGRPGFLFVLSFLLYSFGGGKKPVTLEFPGMLMHASSSVAPPSYAQIVTEEQRQSSLDVPAAREGLDGPLFAYIHEFRFQPPPLYSEVRIPT